MRQRKSYTPEELLKKHEQDYQRKKEHNINWRLNHPEQYDFFKTTYMKNYYQENKERLNALKTERRRQKRQEEHTPVQLIFV